MNFMSESDKKLLLERSQDLLPQLSNFWDALYHYRLGKSEGLNLLKESDLDDHFKYFFADKNLEADKANSLVPKALDAKLKPHQLEGFNWLYENYKKGFGSCLADDMGLGKTLQIISLFTKIYFDDGSNSSNVSLVLCPSSLTKNWINECAKFAPGLKV